MPSKPKVEKEDNFPKEEIPNEDSLFCRVSKANYKDQVLNLRMVFKNIGEGMSANWSRHSTALKTKESAKFYGRDPNTYGIISMNVGRVRNIKDQIVEHTPRPYNQAHTDIKGEKTERALIAFSRAYTWEIMPPKT